MPDPAELLQEALPNDSNWFLFATLLLLAIIYFLRNVWPSIGKNRPAEVKTELAPEDKEILKSLRAEIRQVREIVDELLVQSKVNAALRDNKPRPR